MNIAGEYSRRAANCHAAMTTPVTKFTGAIFYRDERLLWAAAAAALTSTADTNPQGCWSELLAESVFNVA